MDGGHTQVADEAGALGLERLVAQRQEGAIDREGAARELVGSVQRSARSLATAAGLDAMLVAQR